MSTANAYAFWWLLRGATARGAGTAVARGATAGGAIAAEESAAISATRSAGSSARYCVRPSSATACDFTNGANAMRAVENAVGPGYRVRQTQRSGVFEIIDAAGKVVDIVEAIDRLSQNRETNFEQFIPPPTKESIIIYNPVDREMYFRVKGGGGPWFDVTVPQSGWAQVNGMRGVQFEIEIISRHDQTGQTMTVRQSFWPGRNLAYYRDQNQGGIWLLAEQ